MNTNKEEYYNLLFEHFPGWEIRGLFHGNRSIDQIETIQAGNKGSVFFFDQEPLRSDMDQELWDYVFQKPTILANSEINSDDKNYLKSKYPNFVDWYYFSHVLVAREWFKRYHDLRAGWFHQRHFLSDFGLVTGPRQYRLFLLFMLFNQLAPRTHEFCYIGYKNNQPWKLDLESNDKFGLLNLDYEKTFPGAIRDGEHIFTPDEIFSQSVSYDNYGQDSLHGNNLKQTVIPIEKYSDVNFVLVNETVFEEQKHHLTEKIFKPIAVGKPFILSGGFKNLEYLRNYGFKTFNTCWSEQYDQINDPKDRAQNIFETVQYLIELSFGCKSIEIFSQAHKIADYNREHFWSETLYNQVITEALDNLERAKTELAAKCVQGATMMSAT